MARSPPNRAQATKAPSIVQELGNMHPGQIGEASARAKALVMACWLLACLWASDHWVFSKKREDIAKRQDTLATLDQKIGVLEKQLAEQQATLDRSSSKDPRNSFRSWQRDPARGQMVDWAKQQATALGFEARFVETELSHSVHETWDVQASQAGLTHQTWTLEAEASLDALFFWLDQLADPTDGGRVWIHQMTLQRGDREGLVRLDSTVGFLFLATPDPEHRNGPVAGQLGALSNSSSSNSPSNPPKSLPRITSKELLGLDRMDRHWWTHLPLQRMVLVGFGQLNDASMVWALDPSQKVQALSLGDTLESGRYRIARIDSKAVWLSDARMEREIIWELP